jgi:hypothetical protein
MVPLLVNVAIADHLPPSLDHAPPAPTRLVGQSGVSVDMVRLSVGIGRRRAG